MRPSNRRINAYDLMIAAQASIIVDKALAAMHCPHCGAVGLVIAEALPDGKRNVRCKTCKKVQAEEIEAR